jgi:hypothetical protein
MMGLLDFMSLPPHFPLKPIKNSPIKNYDKLNFTPH